MRIPTLSLLVLSLSLAAAQALPEEPPKKLKQPFLVYVGPADDTAARVSDHTFDIGENSSPPRTLVESAASFARQEGATVTRSSVHLHVGFDAEDKASGAVRWLTQSLGENPKELRRHYAFIGDSENDASCFGEFETTIAVSNWPRSSVGPEPRYVTRHPMGSGFAEAARVLSAQRSRCGPV